MKFSKYLIAGKDILYLTDENAFDTIEKSDVKLICDRIKGVGADTIAAINQNSSKNAAN